MKQLIVSENPMTWELGLEEVAAITPEAYLADEAYKTRRNLTVINLCKSYQYLSLGYYVSLLAEARGHKVLPSVGSIQDFRFPSILKEDSLDFDELIQASLKNISSEKAEFNIFFGMSGHPDFGKLATQLFSTFQAPFLKVTFQKRTKWLLYSIRPVNITEIPQEEAGMVEKALKKYLFRPGNMKNPLKKSFDLAILVNPDEATPPSDARALQKFVKAAEKSGFYTELITKNDFAKLVQFDALLIRETTQVNHHTFRMAKKAESLGLAVIDDPNSILKCTNKVYLSELLKTKNIPGPKTWVIQKGIEKSAVEKMGLPLILKQPDGAFSKGVVKAENYAEFKTKSQLLFQKSDLLIAQEFLPTPFDWRVGVLAGEVIYVCKYFMASSHWQIVDWTAPASERDGLVESLDPQSCPAGLLATAIKASGLIGNGLYGVDMKEINGKFLVIEVNDNPSIDSGIEDKISGEKLYLQIVNNLLSRVKARL